MGTTCLDRSHLRVADLLEGNRSNKSRVCSCTGGSGCLRDAALPMPSATNIEVNKSRRGALRESAVRVGETGGCAATPVVSRARACVGGATAKRSARARARVFADPGRKIRPFLLPCEVTLRTLPLIVTALLRSSDTLSSLAYHPPTSALAPYLAGECDEGGSSPLPAETGDAIHLSPLAVPPYALHLPLFHRSSPSLPHAARAAAVPAPDGAPPPPLAAARCSSSTAASRRRRG